MKNLSYKTYGVLVALILLGIVSNSFLANDDNSKSNVPDSKLSDWECHLAVTVDGGWENITVCINDYVSLHEKPDNPVYVNGTKVRWLLDDNGKKVRICQTAPVVFDELNPNHYVYWDFDYPDLSKPGKYKIELIAYGEADGCEVTGVGSYFVTVVDVEISGPKKILVGPDNKKQYKVKGDLPVKWEVFDDPFAFPPEPAVATIDQNGVLTGVAEGTAKIIATYGKCKDEYTVEIVDGEIALSGPDVLCEGEGADGSIQLEVIPDTSSTYEFESDKPQVVSVDSEGKVHAKSKGEAVITVKDEDDNVATHIICVVEKTEPMPKHLSEAKLNIFDGPASNNQSVYGYVNTEKFMTNFAYEVAFDCETKKWKPYLSEMEHDKNIWVATLKVNKDDNGAQRPLIDIPPGLNSKNKDGSFVLNFDTWIQMSADCNVYNGGTIANDEYASRAAVKAHEDGHMAEYQRAANVALSVVKNFLDNVGVDHRCGMTESEAHGEIQLILNNDVIKSLEAIYEQATNKEHRGHPVIDPVLKPLEGAVYDPLDAAIYNKAVNSGWIE